MLDVNKVVLKASRMVVMSVDSRVASQEFLKVIGVVALMVKKMDKTLVAQLVY
jgi:hypothetical protein